MSSLITATTYSVILATSAVAESGQSSFNGNLWPFIGGVIVFAILTKIALSLEEPILRVILSIVFIISLSGCGLMTIIIVGKLLWHVIKEL